MTGKKNIDLIILGLSTFMTAAVLGIFVYTEIIFSKEAPSEEKEKKELMLFMKKKSEQDNFKVDKVIVNLASAGSRLRFLDVEMYLVPFKIEFNDIFEKHKPYVTDTIISVSSNMSPNELNSVAGKILLQSRIRKRLNSYFQKDLVKEIYFSRFVVQ